MALLPYGMFTTVSLEDKKTTESISTSELCNIFYLACYASYPLNKVYFARHKYSSAKTACEKTRFALATVFVTSKFDFVLK